MFKSGHSFHQNLINTVNTKKCFLTYHIRRMISDMKDHVTEEINGC